MKLHRAIANALKRPWIGREGRRDVGPPRCEDAKP